MTKHRLGPIAFLRHSVELDVAKKCHELRKCTDYMIIDQYLNVEMCQRLCFNGTPCVICKNIMCV